jgi:iron complex outermembrane receptor protein
MAGHRSLELAIVQTARVLVILKFRPRLTGGAAHGGFLKFNPYYTLVQDFVEVDVCAAELRQPRRHTDGRQPVVAHTGAWGKLDCSGNAAWVRGKRRDGGALCHMMPPNALLALEHALGHWTGRPEAKLVGCKKNVDARRLEPATGGYAVLDLRTDMELRKNLRLSAGVNKLLDKDYADPFSGVYLSGLQAEGSTLRPLPGYGRSFDAGLELAF